MNLYFKAMGRILGIDYGMKRIGLSLSDPSKILASPLPTLLAEKKMQRTATKLLEAVAEHEIEKIVIGLPYRLSGAVGLQADEVKSFIKELEKQTDIPVVTWDERLTSAQVERTMKDAGLSRKKRAKHVDKLAAIVILQSYLDSQVGGLFDDL